MAADDDIGRLPHHRPRPAAAPQAGPPRLLRALNERAVLEHLRRSGSASRGQVAQETGLSKPTISQALAHLEDAGLVRRVGRRVPHRGRTAVLYEADPTAGYVVGIDIGRAWVRVTAADLAGTVVARSDAENRARSGRALIRRVAELAHEVVAEAGITWPSVLRTVVGSPGVLDPEGGGVRYAPNLPGWSRAGLVDALEAALGSAVELHNDANLAALGERSYGRGADCDTFVYLWVGTGIGMGIIIGGELYAGANGAAGEIGYLPYGEMPFGEPDPARPAARRRGLLEESAAAGGVVRTGEALGVGAGLSAKQVFDAARGGEPAALAAVAHAAERLAVAVASVAAILDPGLVVLGGGIGRNVDMLRGPMEQRLVQLSPLQPPIVASELGDDAVVLGAIATALDSARECAFTERAGYGRA
jgi:predicted NBD/HSP70 family sugar kinase